MNDSPLNDAHAYCFDLVRKHDRDRFICASLAPGSCREALISLYAFNIEIAGTGESVSERTIGQMRLKWWFDALEHIYDGQPPTHQVAEPFSRAVSGYNLDRSVVRTMIESRNHDLDDRPFGTMAALETYAAETAGNLACLSLDIADPSAAESRERVRHAGIAYALVGMVRALPVNFVRRRIFLPDDVCDQVGLNVSRLLDTGRIDEVKVELTAAVGLVLNRAAHHLSLAKPPGGKRLGRAVNAALPAVLARHYAGQLHAANGNPFDMPPGPPGPGVIGMLKLAAASWRSAI